MKGNYDEGFGKEQHKTKWAPSTGGFEGNQADTTTPSKVSHLTPGDRPEAPEEEVPAGAVEAAEPVADEVVAEPVAEEVAAE